MASAYCGVTKGIAVVAILILLVSSGATTLHAQTETATISGLVTDEGGGIVPNCEVVLQSVDRGTLATARTNDAGIYVFASVQPGQYNLTIKRNGFKQVDFLGLILNVQDHVEQNFRLHVGSVSESVTVEAGGLNINTTDAAVSTVIDRKFVENLPLNGRSFNTLLQLIPGVVIAAQGNVTAAPGQFSIAGQRTDANNFTVDGVSANFGVDGHSSAVGQSGTGSAQAFSALGGTSSLASVEAVQEFRVETSSFAPEFGRAPGGQVIMTTRSGTNDFHGGIYEYFRNDVMDASNWFNGFCTLGPNCPLPKGAERHNDFGAFLGGPIVKDRTFFFASYEGARLRLPSTFSIPVPSEFARTSAPAALAPYLNAFPQPNDQTIIPGVFTAQATVGASSAATLNAGSIRIDHFFNERYSIFGRYNEAPSDFAERFIANNPSQLEVNTRTLTFGFNSALNDRLNNDFRINRSTQYTARVQALDSTGGAVPLPTNLLVGNLSATDTAGGLIIIGAGNYDVGPLARNSTRQVNVRDDLSWTAGTHQMKYGVDYRMIDLSIRPPQNQLTYLSTGVSDFITSNGSVFVFPVTENSASVRSQSFSLYAQDTWKVSPRLTLTYGLRWELSPAPSALNGTKLASWTNVNDPAQIALAPLGTPLWATTYGNFAPRAGLAYSLTNKGDFVLRVGAGVFFDLGVGSAASTATAFPNLASGFALAQLPIADPTPLLPQLSTSAPYPSAYAFAPDLKLPRSYQWNLALEKSFGKQAFSATYVGQAGRSLLRQTALFQPNPNFSGEFQLTANDAFSNYHALQLQYRRPFSSRVQLLLNYTWSHSLDSASNDVIAGLSNTVISAASDYASSNFDVRHSFSGAVHVAIPAAAKSGVFMALTRDWSIDSVVVARSGFPFNAIEENISPDPGFVAITRPDRVPGQPLWIPDAAAPGGQSLNVNAFATPSTARQGTEGRNDIPGFGLTQVDISLGRKFSFSESVALQFRADAFNVLNHPNFTNPRGFYEFGPTFLQSQSTLNNGLGGLSPLFQEGGPRSVQLSLKLTF